VPSLGVLWNECSYWYPIVCGAAIVAVPASAPVPTLPLLEVVNGAFVAAAKSDAVLKGADPLALATSITSPETIGATASEASTARSLRSSSGSNAR
jgi:hypothetical protein